MPPFFQLFHDPGRECLFHLDLLSTDPLPSRRVERILRIHQEVHCIHDNLDMALRLLHKKRAGNCFSLDALTEEPEARELVEEAVQSAERARLLRACMAELHEDYREALFLVYFEGLSHAETAAVMGKREKQVADLIYRGKIALRKRLEQEGITDAYNG